MPTIASIQCYTRVSDLDTQRHVNNVVFEDFALAGRYALLAQAGYPIERLLAENIALRPLAARVKFISQVKDGAQVTVNTTAHAAGQGVLAWDHALQDAAGQPLCALTARIVAEREGQALDLLAVQGVAPPDDIAVPPFTGAGRRVASPHTVRYADRDVFGRYPISVYWTMLEEARWQFAETVGLPLETLLALDTTLFWIAG